MITLRPLVASATRTTRAITYVRSNVRGSIARPVDSPLVCQLDTRADRRKGRPDFVAYGLAFGARMHGLLWPATDLCRDEVSRYSAREALADSPIRTPLPGLPRRGGES